MSCRGVLPLVISVRLSAHLGNEWKMLRSDLCNRLTTRAPYGPFDSRARSLRLADRTRPRRIGAAWAPARRCRRTDPWVDARLTARFQLGPHRTTSARPAERGKPGDCPGADPPRRGVFDRARSWRPTSDALCRSPQPARSEDRAFTKNQTRFPSPSVKRTSFPEPERLPSTSALRSAACATGRLR